MIVDTEVLKIDPARPNPDLIARAEGILDAGGVIAFPTETVYGLGCLAEHTGAVARIYEIKQRPPQRPLAVYLADPAEIFDYAEHVSAEGRRLIERTMPGPVTLIFSDRASGTTGFRVSTHPVLTELIRTVGRRLVGTSANVSGRPSSTSASDVLDAFEGRIDAVLDAGPAPLGVESTVIDCTTSPPTLLREGAIADDEIRALLGGSLADGRGRAASPDVN
jgi:L-threonylcarbamoyladenylate synthase